MFKCVRCGREFKDENDTAQFECECGSKVFIRVPGNVVKTVEVK
ncbi:MAG: DNA-directed RNA polymerase subunit P [Thermoplasmatales archaeon]